MTKAKKRSAKKAIKAVAAHAQLAHAILRGEFTRPCTWSLLKLMYFRRTTDAACELALQRWAKKHGIGYSKRPIRITAPGIDTRDYEITFRRR